MNSVDVAILYLWYSRKFPINKEYWLDQAAIAMVTARERNETSPLMFRS